MYYIKEREGNTPSLDLLERKIMIQFKGIIAYIKYKTGKAVEGQDFYTCGEYKDCNGCKKYKPDWCNISGKRINDNRLKVRSIKKLKLIDKRISEWEQNHKRLLKAFYWLDFILIIALCGYSILGYMEVDPKISVNVYSYVAFFLGVIITLVMVWFIESEPLNKEKKSIWKQ